MPPLGDNAAGVTPKKMRMKDEIPGKEFPGFKPGFLNNAPKPEAPVVGKCPAPPTGDTKNKLPTLANSKVPPKAQESLFPDVPLKAVDGVLKEASSAISGGFPEKALQLLLDAEGRLGVRFFSLSCRKVFSSSRNPRSTVYS